MVLALSSELLGCLAVCIDVSSQTWVQACKYLNKNFLTIAQFVPQIDRLLTFMSQDSVM